MKTQLTLFRLLLALLVLGSCEKDELESSVPGNMDGLEGKNLKSYNNGIIKAYPGDLVLSWNETISLAIDNKMPPPAEAKIYAMASLAMHDALNNLIPKYDTYALSPGDENATDISKINVKSIADAAVSQAAHDVLIALFPAATPSATERLNSILAVIEDEEHKMRGVTLGGNAATAILQKRANDIPFLFTTYQMGTDPGVHQANYMPWQVAGPIWPDYAVYGANMGMLTPFGMKTSDQFRANPPYPINSNEYTEDFEEVKRLGCVGCTERTTEQTEIGAFWVENVSSSTSRLARELARKKKLDGWQTARLMALLHITQIDANISSFEGKYHYNYWRPITAVRVADSDGNGNTAGDPGWTPTFTTPPTPDYPSTHAHAGGAGSELLKLYFGTDRISEKVSSPYILPGVTRTMTSFTQIGRENALSRIYIGYHFRKAIEEGEANGRALGKYVFENSLQELKK